MDVDGGCAGLSQSRHHANYGRGSYNDALNTDEAHGDADAGDDDPKRDDIRSQLAREIFGKGDPSELSQAQVKTLHEVLALTKRHFTDNVPCPKCHNPAGSQATESITKLNLRQEVQKAVQEALGGHGIAKDRPIGGYAAALKSGLHSAAITPSEKIVPARHQRQIAVRPGEQEEAQKKRTYPEIVQAINTNTTRANGAIAARIYEDRTHLITFADTKERDWHAENTGWLRTIGEHAEIAVRLYTVTVRGVPQDLARGNSIEISKAQIGDQNKVNVAEMRLSPRRDKQGSPYCSLFLGVKTVAEAKQLCDQGVVWEAQLFTCEPYESAVRAQQCYRCYGWDHKAKFCKRTARCGRCAEKAHPEGEKDCPHFTNKAEWRCVSCKGSHASFEWRNCPVAAQQMARAQAAYRERPTTFAGVEATRQRGAFMGNAAFPPSMWQAPRMAVPKKRGRPPGQPGAQRREGSIAQALTSQGTQRSEANSPQQRDSSGTNTNPIQC